MYRSWATTEPLTVVGPKPVIDACKEWVRGPGVDFVTITAGRDIVLGPDLVLLEETFGDSADTTGGHHNLATFALALGQLREWGCAQPSTDVVAIHLSHHNPPPEQLYLRLRDIGARAVPDLSLIHI